MSGIKNLENRLSTDFSSLKVGEVLFITGAGISSATPTKFPIGQELHELVLKTFTTWSKSKNSS